MIHQHEVTALLYRYHRKKEENDFFLCTVKRFMYNQLLIYKCIISIYMILHKPMMKENISKTDSVFSVYESKNN